MAVDVVAAGLVLTDGGRSAAGFSGVAGDCATRAIAVAAERPYRLVYDELFARQARYVDRRGLPRRRASPRPGVFHDVWRPYLAELGWRRVRPLRVGSVLRARDLPSGRLVVELPRHLTAVIDGTVHDAFDPPRHVRVLSVWTGPVADGPLDHPWALRLFA